MKLLRGRERGGGGEEGRERERERGGGTMGLLSLRIVYAISEETNREKQTRKRKRQT